MVHRHTEHHFPTPWSIIVLDYLYSHGQKRYSQVLVLTVQPNPFWSDINKIYPFEADAPVPPFGTTTFVIVVSTWWSSLCAIIDFRSSTILLPMSLSISQSSFWGICLLRGTEAPNGGTEGRGGEDTDDDNVDGEDGDMSVEWNSSYKWIKSTK